MKYTIPFLFFLLLIITSCNQLYRGIPKAPRHKIITENKVSESTESDDELSLNENLTKEVEFKTEDQNSTFSESENNSKSEEKQSHVKQEEFFRNTNSKTVKDTLFVDADVLEEGESCIRLQTVVNVGTSLMFILFIFSAIFIIFGIYNINKYKNLPYVTQETDAKMQRKIRNFYIALGVYLFLFLLILALILI